MNQPQVQVQPQNVPSPNARLQPPQPHSPILQGMTMVPARLYLPPNYIPPLILGTKLGPVDMAEILEHFQTTATLAVDERRDMHLRKTFDKAERVREWMEWIHQICQPSPLHLRNVDLIALRYALRSLRVARTHYTILLPSTFRINDLPVELLVHIFRLAVWPAIGTREGLRGATHLSHVCQHWRSITITDKRLWNPVLFKYPFNIENALLVLERAGPTNLDIRIRDNRDNPMSEDQVAKVIDGLWPFMTGIRSLEIITMNTTSMIPVLYALSRVPYLKTPMTIEYLHLDCVGSFPSDPISPFFSQPLFGGGHPPFFKHLCLSNTYMNWEGLLFSQLTTLEFRYTKMEHRPPSSVFRKMLQNTKCLEKLVLEGAGPRYPPDVALDTGPVFLPRLRILLIGTCQDLYFKYVLSHFSSPNVLDLSVNTPFDMEPSHLLEALTTTNPMPQVRILNLKGFPRRDHPFSTDQLLPLATWFRMIPELEFLRIVATNLCILQVLQVLRDQKTVEYAIAQDWPGNRMWEPLCKKLRYLDWQTEVSDFETVLSFLSVRKYLKCPLRRVWYNLNPGVMKWENSRRLSECLEGDGRIALSEVQTEEEHSLCPVVH